MNIKKRIKFKHRFCKYNQKQFWDNIKDFVSLKKPNLFVDGVYCGKVKVSLSINTPLWDAKITSVHIG